MLSYINWRKKISSVIGRYIVLQVFYTRFKIPNTILNRGSTFRCITGTYKLYDVFILGFWPTILIFELLFDI